MQREAAFGVFGARSEKQSPRFRELLMLWSSRLLWFWRSAESPPNGLMSGWTHRFRPMNRTDGADELRNQRYALLVRFAVGDGNQVPKALSLLCRCCVHVFALFPFFPFHTPLTRVVTSLLTCGKVISQSRSGYDAKHQDIALHTRIACDYN